MSDMSRAGLPQLVQEIKLASENIRKTDDVNREKLENIEQSINELYRRTGRPGAEISNDGDERKCAIEMCKSHHAITVNASQMPNVTPGSTPIAFGDWKRTYTIVTRKNPTISVDPYSAGFCVLYKAEARVGGGVTCPNSARLLRIK
jgi:hypothetical protein